MMMLAKPLRPVILSQTGGGDVPDRDISAGDLLVNEAAVHQNQSAGLYRVHKLIQRGQVHGHQHVGGHHQGGTNGLMGKADAAVRSAAPHFRAVRGEPGDLHALLQAGIGQHLSGKQDALPAETGP